MKLIPVCFSGILIVTTSAVFALDKTTDTSAKATPMATPTVGQKIKGFKKSLYNQIR